MASLKGVNIIRGKLGASVNTNSDGICGLLATGVATSELELLKAVELHSTDDLEALGITEDYDKENHVCVYRHVSEFFRIAGDGATLHLMLYSGSPVDIFDEGGAARQLIAAAKGEIRILALAYTPGENEDPLNLTALIQKAQNFYDWTFDTFRPCQVVLEHNGFAASTAVSAQDLKAIAVGDATLEAFKVSVCIGQDYQYADQFTDSRRTMADVGTMLGSIAAKAVNENIGEVATGNLTNATKGIWVEAGLSNHKKISEWDSQLETLDEKAYIFAVAYAGFAGFYWNNDYTCTPVIKDKDGYFNEYTISYGRILDKCVRDLRTALLPYVKGSQQVDPKTGKLPQSTIAYFESVGDTVFESMQARGIITRGKTTVNADSNLLVTPRVLEVSFVVVPTGCIDEIKGTINLKTNI